MVRTNSGLLLATAILAMTVTAPAALAQGFREAPAISKDPAADVTSLWAWVTPTTHDKLYIVVGFNPQEEPAGGPMFHGFADDVLYEIHITRGGSSLADVLTYQFRFTTSPVQRNDPADLGLPMGGGKEFLSQLAGQTQTYSVTKVVSGTTSTVIGTSLPVAPAHAGPLTDGVLGRSYDDAFATTFIRPLLSGAEGRVWAGPRDEGYYGDLGGLYDVLNFRAKGAALDAVSGFNCHAISLEIPTTIANGGPLVANGTPNTSQTVGIWASASRRQVTMLQRNGTTTYMGPWIQVSRVGFPLINDLLIGIQDKDAFNRARPTSDIASFGSYFLNPVIVRDAEAVGFYAALAVDPTPFKSGRLDILDLMNLKDIPSAGAHNISLAATGDVLRVDLGINSFFPNGRSIPGPQPSNEEGSDVTDVFLSLVLMGLSASVSDGVDYNDRIYYMADMPWLPLPSAGFNNQGHGTPTP